MSDLLMTGSNENDECEIHSRQAGHGLRLGMFNVKYSPNLGDGILSECLEAELMRAIPGSRLTTLDLAGRQSFSKGSLFRTIAMTLLELSPNMLRRLLVSMVLGWALRRRMRPIWREALRDCDAVIIGGGNLFGDSDLNFPLKLHGALGETRHANLPAAVFGVGVSDNWSPRGEALFRAALQDVDLVYVSVRDPRSRDVWQRRLGPVGVPAARPGRDPGLLVADLMEVQRSGSRDRPLVGLGLTHPVALSYHAGSRYSEAALTAWIAALVKACVQRGWRVALFTNGSPEDVAYLDRTGPALAASAAEGAVTCMRRFDLPRDLARFIGGLDLLMAHRLHANCTAYSFGVPHIGFTWDEKLESFFDTVGRSDFVCKTASTPPDQIAALGERAMREGIDPDRHRAVLASARSDIEDLAAALQAGVAARRQARCPVEPLVKP